MALEKAPQKLTAEFQSEFDREVFLIDNGGCLCPSCHCFGWLYWDRIDEHNQTEEHQIASAVDSRLVALFLEKQINKEELCRKEKIYHLCVCHVCGDEKFRKPLDYYVHLHSQRHIENEKRVDGYDGIGIDYASWDTCKEPFCSDHALGIDPKYRGRHNASDVHTMAMEAFALLANKGLTKEQIISSADAVHRRTCEIPGCPQSGHQFESFRDALMHVDTGLHLHPLNEYLDLDPIERQEIQKWFCQLKTCPGRSQPHPVHARHAFTSLTAYIQHRNFGRHAEILREMKPDVSRMLLDLQSSRNIVPGGITSTAEQIPQAPTLQSQSGMIQHHDPLPTRPIGTPTQTVVPATQPMAPPAFSVASQALATGLPTHAPAPTTVPALSVVPPTPQVSFLELLDFDSMPPDYGFDFNQLAPSQAEHLPSPVAETQPVDPELEASHNQLQEGNLFAPAHGRDVYGQDWLGGNAYQNINHDVLRDHHPNQINSQPMATLQSTAAARQSLLTLATTPEQAGTGAVTPLEIDFDLFPFEGFPGYETAWPSNEPQPEPPAPGTLAEARMADPAFADFLQTQAVQSENPGPDEQQPGQRPRGHYHSINDNPFPKTNHLGVNED